MDVVLAEKVAQRGERDVAGEDQGRGTVVEGSHDLDDARLDQKMIAVGLVAEQVVHEEMPRHAVEFAVEMERALPSPDIEMRISPDHGAPGQLVTQGAQSHPLAAPLVADGQVLGRNKEVSTDLHHQSCTDRQA
jgi:hypothetical protein